MSLDMVVALTCPHPSRTGSYDTFHGVVFPRKTRPLRLCVLLRLGHFHRRGTIHPGYPYNGVCSLKNNSTPEQLNVWGNRVASC